MKQFRVFCACAVLAGIALPSAAVAPATGPSYDCNRAQGQVQELICSSDSLAALDRTLADVYAIAIGNFPPDELATLKAEQRGWIKGRDDCWKADDINACVVGEYQQRTVALQLQSGQLMGSTSIRYDCDGNKAVPFHAAFYRDTDPASVVLTYGQDQVIAFIAPSGSGARYTASDVEFWEHQGEATLDWFGNQWTCRPVR